MQKTLTKNSLWRSIVIVAMAATLVISTMTAFVSARPGNGPNRGPNIVETALQINAESGEFSTLISAVVNLDLLDALSSNRPYTVFAPTDAAFADLELDADSFIGLSDDEKAAFTDIVLYHVTRGVRGANSIVNANKVKMLNGDFAYVDGASIGGATIVGPDAARVSNGVIHIVDSVLLPPM
ncbi:MAG: fasciclin domain-containing protein [Candidatus Saccharimonadales bacterium]|nr:fasciclin domain-containing protein [Candidatus Saccharimonadales bacterium]